MHRCKGLFFNVRMARYDYQKSWAFTKRTDVRFLKRRSCPGCAVCTKIREDIALVPSKLSLEYLVDSGVYKLCGQDSVYHIRDYALIKAER